MLMPLFQFTAVLLGLSPETLTAENVASPPPISAKEPLAAEFSLERAVRSVDASALHWQETKKCGTCHTNFAHLWARPSLARVIPPPPEVRTFFEEMVRERWESKGPRWDAEVVVAAAALAMNDRDTTGKLHPLTRKALDRMVSLQRPDGGWEWLKCGWPPMESDDHYGVTFAALGIAAAPEGYAATENGKRCLEGIRRYLRANPPPSLHHQAMVFWASLGVEGILNEKERRNVLETLWALERPGGGWATAALLEGWKDHRRQDSEPQDLATADGYATGLVIYLSRLSGARASHPPLERGVRWLRVNQRQSGRWFTRSPTKDSQHYLSNFGTVFAALALEACQGGEGGAPRPVRRF